MRSGKGMLMRGRRGWLWQVREVILRQDVWESRKRVWGSWRGRGELISKGHSSTIGVVIA